MANNPLRILITGAAGFVGGHLTTALAAAFPEAQRCAPAFDITDAAAVSGIVADLAPDVCVHLAASSTHALTMTDEARAWSVNLHGTLNLARAILRDAPNCLMLFASSAETYGASFRRGTRLDETAPLAPLNSYGTTKAAADLALGAMAEQGLRVARFRPTNHTGTGQSSGLVVAAFARQLARIEAGLAPPLIEVGNLEPRRDFLDVRDVCAAYVACIARRDRIEPGAIFNLGSGETKRIGDVLDELKEIAGVAADVRIDPAKIRPTDVKLAACDATRARDLLNWAPAVPWRQTLRDVLNDWRRRIAADPESP